MSGKHSNISLFVPHIGCPNKCSFCDQRHITGTSFAPVEKDVIAAVSAAQNSPHYDPSSTEIAFFGGSFTAINRSYMLMLLKAASAFVENHTVCGIRISTRPDAIDDEILSLLKRYHVTSIELGTQSLDDRVLKLNNRGHTAKDVYRAVANIRRYDFELGLQIMTGLYADSDELTLETAQKVIDLHPDTVRIYPTIVLKNTDLAALYADHRYESQTLEQAVNICSRLYPMFCENGIRVIRLGLHSIEKSAYIAGPWHPAFSELCLSKIMLDRVLSQLKEKGSYILRVSPSDVSKMIGQKRGNMILLEQSGYFCKVKADETVGSMKINIEREV